MNREAAVEDAVHVGSGGGAVVAAGAVVVGEGVGDFRTVQGGSDESVVFVVGIGGRGAHPLFNFRFMCAVPVGIVGVVNGDGLIFPAEKRGRSRNNVIRALLLDYGTDPFSGNALRCQLGR